jgi:hypothetical protein
MKQTATNYLIDQLELKVMAQHLPWVAEILDKARQMEHEQIAEAYNQGWNCPHGEGFPETGEQYYSDTYIENRDTQS